MSIVLSRKIWTIVPAAALAMGWLLPFRGQPWPSFYSNLWVSGCIAGVCLFSLFFVPKRIRVSSSPVLPVLFLLTATVWCQLLFGEIKFFGEAWVGSAVLLGLIVSIYCGELLQRWQPDYIVDVVFMAVGTAATISVFIQFAQWLGFASNPGNFGRWIVGFISGRPYANLGQPNQLATLLMWGGVAVLWGMLREKVSVKLSVVLLLVLVCGLVLTQSRTGLVVMTVFVGVLWVNRRVWPSPMLPVAGTLIYGGYLLASYFLVPIGRFFSIAVEEDIGDRIDAGAGVRPALWRMMIDAASERPMFGYGWNQTRLAQLNVVMDHPDAQGVGYSSAHNIVLDLIVWFGIPLGLLVAIVFCFQFVASYKNMGSAKEAVLAMFLIAVGIHSTLEFPLNYVYFLIPSGLIFGAFCASYRNARHSSISRLLPTVALIFSILVGLVAFLDYGEVEKRLRIFRSVSTAQSLGGTETIKPIILLTQLDALMQYAYFKPAGPVSAEGLTWMRNVVSMYPSLGNIIKLSHALALSARPEEAQSWLERGCKVVSKQQCAVGARIWAAIGTEHSAVAKIDWPIDKRV